MGEHLLLIDPIILIWLAVDMSGSFYVVATPIGNLEDITLRAIRILKEVDLIAAEDTRRTGKLLDRLAINTPTVSCHKFNEAKRSSELLASLKGGKSIALVTDAGTPAISDPGVRLIKTVGTAGVHIVPVPGPSALTCALSVCAIGAEQFCFEGFLPSRGTVRARRLDDLAKESRTIVIFEAPHRIVQTIEDLKRLLGEDRAACFCREMTKIHETIVRGSLRELAELLGDGTESRKGEFVIVVAGAAYTKPPLSIDETLLALVDVLPTRVAAQTAAKILDQRSNQLYKRLLELKMPKSID